MCSMRFVFKIGTSLLANEHGQLNVDFLRGIIAQMAEVQKQGNEVVLVSSGAVASGRSELHFEHEKKNLSPRPGALPFRQALAAVGQGVLMETYRAFFKEHGVTVAQALLTNYDFTNRENFLNTKNVFSMLLSNGVIPVVNENDVTTIAELKFGDNDMLSAKTAGMISADYLCILTDVDGLFEEDPKRNPHAKFIASAPLIDDEVRARAGGARSGRSMGGMITKLAAAEYIISVGTSMVIVNGRKKNILASAVALCKKHASHVKNSTRAPFPGDPKVGTFFPSSVNRIESQKKWMRPKIHKNAWIEVDVGARKALTQLGKSLLPSGITGVHGDFVRGDVVIIKDIQGNIGYGQVNYDAKDLDKIKKCHTDKIEKILGYSFEDEAIHRDRMVIAQ